MKTKKLIAFLAAAVITVGAITTGTIILLKNNKKPTGAVTVASLMTPVSEIPAHLLPSKTTEDGYMAPATHYIEFGEYPQTHINSSAVINNLNALPEGRKTGRKYLVNGNPTDANSATWQITLLDEYAYNGGKYVKMPAPKVYTGGGGPNHIMSTGVSLTDKSVNLWFKVEPLLWFVTANDGVTLSVLAVNAVISGIPFHNYGGLSVGYTTYYDSGVRGFLIGNDSQIANTTGGNMSIPAGMGFLQTAFSPAEQDLIKPVELDNKTDQSYNTYNDNDVNTTDKIYLPSYNDMVTWPFSADRGGDIKRKIKETDFAMANYSLSINLNDASYYYLRSAISVSDVWRVQANSAVGGSFVAGSYLALRPAMQIAIDDLQELYYNSYNNGYEAGYAAGYIAGDEDARDELESAIADLEDYIAARDDDYNSAYIDGYNDGKTEYIRDNGFVTWNILTGSGAAGDLSEYTPYGIPVRYDYGDEITPPENIQPVQSKQYMYTFLYWSTSRQTNGILPKETTFPRIQTGRDMYFYAVYKRTECEYTVNWVIPIITNGQLDYTNATITPVTYKYGDAITSLAPPNLYGAGVNYLPNGWSSTQGGAKVTDFGKCTGTRTFYAKYIPQPTV
jgi:hypothetical protein